MVPGGQRYEALRIDAQDNDSDTDHSSTPPQASHPSSGQNTNTSRSDAAWTALARAPSDQSSNPEFELNPITDRTELTLDRPSPPLSDDSQDDITQCANTSSNIHLHPSGAQSWRTRRSNISNVSGDSRTTRSSTPSTRFASMKQVLGRASTRVVNLNGSSSRSHSSIPAVPDIATEHMDPISDHDRLSFDESRSAFSTHSGPRPHTPSNISAHGSTTSHLSPQPVVIDPEPIDPPLEGRSLFIFGPDNAFRKKVNRIVNQK
ncbi:hypothetical protein BGW38_008522 [Lunasporangiospora selenospora]|uniref:Uncharacterized protein n=1 Tax=Lunasporangiospora selenospora TaxID=979761 RepID=A0A9P6KHZ0_9FUNG|nr:hypothetical protein BGW38_008522 [Lunasporangiospora selenospora]